MTPKSKAKALAENLRLRCFDAGLRGPWKTQVWSTPGGADDYNVYVSDNVRWVKIYDLGSSTDFVGCSIECGTGMAWTAEGETPKAALAAAIKKMHDEFNRIILARDALIALLGQDLP